MTSAPPAAASPGPGSAVGRPPIRPPIRQGLRLRLTLLSTALLALIGALLLALSYLVVGRVVAALPQFPAGTTVQIGDQVMDASRAAAEIAAQGRQTVLIVGLIAFPLQVLAGAGLSWVLIGRTLRPLSTLTRTARALSESSLDQRIRLAGPRDEVADLADTFDDMLGRLQAAFDAERRFVANASHEPRTPLAVIRTEVEVTMADPAADAADLRRMGEVVLEATDRANRLLTSLLVLARTQARGVSVHQSVDLADLIGPALDAVHGELTERELTLTVQSSPAVVQGDPALLERLIGNLVENAVRHNIRAGWSAGGGVERPGDRNRSADRVVRAVPAGSACPGRPSRHGSGAVHRQGRGGRTRRDCRRGAGARGRSGGDGANTCRVGAHRLTAVAAHFQVRNSAVSGKGAGAPRARHPTT
jgi:signal transduction histidine kinase